MSRTAQPVNAYRQSALIANKSQKVKEVTLHLPPFHPRQYELVTAHDRIPGLRFVVGAAGTKFGKCLNVHELVPTTHGWREIADIHEGDYVFDENGNPTLVTYATDPMYGHKCYEVVFSDDSVVTVDDGHLWLTETHNCRKNRARVKSIKDRCKSTASKPEVRTTEEIRQTLLVACGSGGKLRPNHSIDLCGAIQFPQQVLPLDPYALGYFLGNGISSCSSICCHEDDAPEIRASFEAAGFPTTDHKDTQIFGALGLVTALNSAGINGNKFVPPQYLTGSVEQRLSLLQGLMDSDGTIDDKGHCCFDNTNKQLADSVQELCHTLGIKTNRGGKEPTINGSRLRVNGEEYSHCYRVWFTTDLPVFRLKRKLLRVRPVAAKAKRRYIVDVRPVESVPVKCIRVDNPRHLFLVGKACIPTHNTWGCTATITRNAWNNPNSLNWWVAPTYKQSQMAYDGVMRLLPEGTFKEQKAELALKLIKPNGALHSTIEFKSGDNPNSLRGFGVHFFVLDEAARVPEESFVSLMTTVTQTRGKGIIISTPWGRNYFYDLYKRGEKFDEDGNPLYEDGQDQYPEWYSMRMPTWANPHVPIESILELKNNLPEDVFRQECAAQFILDSAGVFRGVSDCIQGSLQDPLSGHQYVMGVDLARKNDFTVVLIMDRVNKNVVYFDRFNQIDWGVQYHKVIDAAKRYRALAIVDSTGIGDPIIETFRNGGVFVEPYQIGSAKAKHQLIEKLRLDVEQGNISFPAIPSLVRELQRYEYVISESGTIKYSSPSGEHDDCVVALALANWGVNRDPFIYRYQSQRGI